MTARTKAQNDAGEKNLLQFKKGDPRAIAAGRKGGLARAAAAAGRVVDTKTLTQTMDTLTAEFKRERLGPTAAALAVAMMIRVEKGEIEVTGRELPELLRVLTDIARLESGDATSQTVVAHLSQTDAITRLKELRGTEPGVV